MSNKEELGFILIDNKWFEKGIKGLGHTPFVVYVLILLRRGYDRVSYFTVSYLCQMLGIKSNSTSSINKIKESLILLEKSGYLIYQESPLAGERVELTSDININEKVYAMVNEPKKNFTKVYADEIYKILRQQVDNKEMRGMLAYLCCVLYHINNTTKVCFPSMVTLKKEAKISNDSTCIKYNDMLKKLGIITYKNVGIKVDRNGKYKNGMHVYARVGNESYIDDEIIKIRKRDDYYGVKQEKTELINKRRSIKQQINNLVKKQQGGDICIKQQTELERLEQDYERACEETARISQKEKKKLVQFPNTRDKKTPEYDMTTSEGREEYMRQLSDDCEGWWSL